MLFSLSSLVLFGPACVEFFVESVHFIFLFDDHMIDLHFDAVASLLQEFCDLFLGELIDCLYHSVHLGVAKTSTMYKQTFHTMTIGHNTTYFFYLIRLRRILSRLSTSADGLCFIVLESSKYCLSYCSYIACLLLSFYIDATASL